MHSGSLGYRLSLTNSFLRSAEIKGCHVSMVTAGVGAVVYCLEPVVMQEGVREEVGTLVQMVPVKLCMCYYPKNSTWWQPRTLAFIIFKKCRESCHVSMITAGVRTVVYCPEPVAMQEGVREEVVHWCRWSL